MGAVSIGLNLGTGVRLARRNIDGMISVAIVGIAIDRPVRLLAGACAAGDDAGEPGRGVADTAAMNLVLLRLIGLYAGLSVLAFGGGNGVIPAARRRLSASLAFRRRVPGYVRHLPRRARAGVADRGESRWHGGRRSVSFAAMFALSCLAVHGGRPLLAASRPVRFAGGVGARSGPDPLSA